MKLSTYRETRVHWNRYFPGFGARIVRELWPIYRFVESGPRLQAHGTGIDASQVAFWRRGTTLTAAIEVASCSEVPRYDLAQSLWAAFDTPLLRSAPQDGIRIWEALGVLEERGVENKLPRPWSNGRRRLIWEWLSPIAPEGAGLLSGLQTTLFWTIRAIVTNDQPERFRPLLALWSTGVLVLGTSGDTLIVTRPTEVAAGSGTEPERQVA